MVNSRAEFEKMKKNQAFRRIKYLHPLVAGKTSHAKEAWKEKKKQDKDDLNLQPNLEISMRPDLLQANGSLVHHRHHHHHDSNNNNSNNTRKGPLRGLLYRTSPSAPSPSSSIFSLESDRPSTFHPELIALTNEDIIIKNITYPPQDWKRIKSKSCFPAISMTSPPHPMTSSSPISHGRDELTTRDDVRSTDTRFQFIRSHDSGPDPYHAIPSYFKGWGQRRSMKENKDIVLQPSVRTMDPLINYCRSRHHELFELDKRQLPNLWVREHSVVQTTKNERVLGTDTRDVEDVKPMSKLDVRFVKSENSPVSTR